MNILNVSNLYRIKITLNICISVINYIFNYYTLDAPGGDSGRVVIWNMEPVVSEAAELDSNVPKVLCQLDNHLGKNRSLHIMNLWI